MKEYVKPFVVGFVGVIFGLLCITAYNDHVILMRVVQALSQPQPSPPPSRPPDK